MELCVHHATSATLPRGGALSTQCHVPVSIRRCNARVWYVRYCGPKAVGFELGGCVPTKVASEWSVA